MTSARWSSSGAARAAAALLCLGGKAAGCATDSVGQDVTAPGQGGGAVTSEGASTGGGGGPPAGVDAGDGLASNAGSGGVTDATGGDAGGRGGGAGGAPASFDCTRADVFLCEDFESYAEGAEPGGPRWRPQPAWQSERIRVVGGGEAHRGRRAVALTGTSYAVQLLPAQGFSPPGNAFFVRAFVKLDRGTREIAGHVAFIEGAEREMDDGEELRLGASHGILDVNLIPGTRGSGGGEKTQFSNGDVDVPSSGRPGVALEAGRWYCLEAHFDGAGHRFAAWLDGLPIEGLSVSDWRQGRTAWSPAYRFVKIGAQDFSGRTGRVVYDDLAVAWSRIGCD